MSQEALDRSSRSDAPRSSEPVAPRAEAPSGLGKLRSGLAATLSVAPTKGGGPNGADAGTRLAHERTDLAVERNYLAADRTLMAWIRTALSMISFGFTIGKLGQTLRDVEMKGIFRGPRMVSVESLAYFLVVLGTVALSVAILQYLNRVAEYTAMGLQRRFSVSVFVGLILVLLGAFALTALVIQL